MKITLLNCKFLELTTYSQIIKITSGLRFYINITYNTKDGKQYIGSSKYIYDRFTDHIKGVSSNIRLQRSILKHGITSFNFVIYYYHEDPAVILTDVETKVIQSFPFEELYNFKKEADSMLGYKHTAEAIEKIVSNSGP